MPRRHTGPRPKSKKPPPKQFSFLGDSSAGEPSEAESFQSPELEPNHTDYGFDYTSGSPSTSRRSNVNQRKSSENTSQPRPSSSQRKSIPRNTSSPMVPVLQASRRSETSPNRRSFIPQAARSEPARLPPKKNKRKQNTPLQREKALWHQIKALQSRTDNLTPKAPFSRLIRELLFKYASDACRITVQALEALQISSEIYLTQLFADAYVCTLHRGRVTLGVHDLRLVRFLRGPYEGHNL
ncbi:histone H3-like centromeric protein A [Episyrphus balteatus]|uniref:histone H3-like centromeric protein A n=1 Tax=Episyrphus balteatus TaxID=286459 RepID=UPI002485BF05|nr:histone H3-like centromeric protein A [Episyrphus balteatus]